MSNPPSSYNNPLYLKTKRMSRIVFIGLLLCIAFTSHAQGKKECSTGSDAVHLQKVEFINQRLNLTHDEQKSFWPIYNEYWDKKMKIVCDRKAAIEYGTKNIDKLSDSEVQKQIGKFMKLQQQEYELLVEYNEKFLKVLPSPRVLLLYVLDNEFKAHLLREMKQSGRE